MKLAQLISDLVAIDSVNPGLVPGGAGEGRIAAFIVDWLDEAGCDVTLQEVVPGRPNVIGHLRGTGGGKVLMLNGHMDTVGVAGMPDGHAPRIEQNRVYGRGACDMKASLAGCMFALAQLRELPLRGDVVFTAVIDEEYKSLGTRAIAAQIERWKPDAAIVTEPTEMNIVVAHKGFVWLDVETIGKAAHGSQPKLGVDAIAKMGRVLVGLEELDKTLRANPTHPYLGSGSLHASLISGGQELSSYPAQCKLSIERRTIPGETPEIVRAQIQRILDEATAADPDFRAELTATFDADPFGVSEDALIVQIVRQRAQAVTGREPQLRGVAFWTDAAPLSSAGVPTVLFGPYGEGLHSVVEWIDLDSAHAFTDTLVKIAAEFCA